jgi:hypothetical protein
LCRLYSSNAWVDDLCLSSHLSSVVSVLFWLFYRLWSAMCYRYKLSDKFAY